MATAAIPFPLMKMYLLGRNISLISPINFIFINVLSINGFRGLFCSTRPYLLGGILFEFREIVGQQMNRKHLDEESQRSPYS